MPLRTRLFVGLCSCGLAAIKAASEACWLNSAELVFNCRTVPPTCTSQKLTALDLWMLNSAGDLETLIPLYQNITRNGTVHSLLLR
jgi:hypothetical protein